MNEMEVLRLVEDIKDSDARRRRLIAQLVKACGGRQQDAARVLGVHQSSISRALAKRKERG